MKEKIIPYILILTLTVFSCFSYLNTIKTEKKISELEIRNRKISEELKGKIDQKLEIKLKEIALEQESLDATQKQVIKELIGLQKWANLAGKNIVSISEDQDKINRLYQIVKMEQDELNNARILFRLSALELKFDLIKDQNEKEQTSRLAVTPPKMNDFKSNNLEDRLTKIEQGIWGMGGQPLASIDGSIQDQLNALKRKVSNNITY